MQSVGVNRSIACLAAVQRSSRVLAAAARIKVLLMRSHNWSRFSFGAWLKTASERLHRNKLARIAWSVLRYDKAFDTHLEAEAI